MRWWGAHELDGKVIRSLRRPRGSASVRRRRVFSNPSRPVPNAIRCTRRARDVTPLRVTGGVLAGRRLRVPRRGVRPTADRVRESAFAILGDLSDAMVLDLYAGSGALGIEALSRGARFVVFVEQASASLDVLRRNLADLDLEGRSRVMRGDAVRSIRRLGGEGVRFDLVLADPPYATPIDSMLRELVAAGILSPGGTLVVERGRGHAVTPVEGLALVESREYGDTVLSRLEASIPSGG